MEVSGGEMNSGGPSMPHSPRWHDGWASMGDAVITTDSEGRVTSLNGVAESLTGWKLNEALGQPLDAVLRIVNEHTRLPVENPVKKVLAEGQIVGLANHTTLITRDGTERPIDDSAAPVRDAAGAYDRFAPRLHKHAAALISEWCDAVLFATRNTCRSSSTRPIPRRGGCRRCYE
jgi:PAS domain S-box-containing protein